MQGIYYELICGCCKSRRKKAHVNEIHMKVRIGVDGLPIYDDMGEVFGDGSAPIPDALMLYPDPDDKTSLMSPTSAPIPTLMVCHSMHISI